MKEREQIAIFDRLKKGELTQIGAAKALGLTPRWIRSKLKRYKEQGALGLVHRGRNKPNGRRWGSEKKKFAMQLFKEVFSGFGPTFAAQKLDALYSIKVSKETLRKAMIENGHWRGKKRKIKHRERRERKKYYGEMVQLDASPHDWFEGRRPNCTSITLIDDATSLIGFMMFAPSESNESVMIAVRKYVEINGAPKSFYVDYGSVFSVNTNNPERDKITQFERACKELGIAVIHAGSPQAKGRVERSHGTHQDRLIKELRLAGISTMEEANKFIREIYVPLHNKMFAIDDLHQGNIHRPVDHINLDKVFCLIDIRQLQNDFTLAYKTRILQLTKHQQAVVRPKEKISVYENFDGSLHLYIRNIRLNFIELQQRPAKPVKESKIKLDIYHKPAPAHPWRRVAACQPKQNGGY